MSINDKSDYFCTIFNGINVSSKTISYSDFESCIFECGDLSETEFRHCNFINCIFSSCNLDNINFFDSKFYGTKFFRKTDSNIQNCFLPFIKFGRIVDLQLFSAPTLPILHISSTVFPQTWHQLNIDFQNTMKKINAVAF